MLSLLAGYDDAYGPLRILRYITLRTLLASGTAALIGFIIGPWKLICPPSKRLEVRATL